MTKKDDKNGFLDTSASQAVWVPNNRSSAIDINDVMNFFSRQWWIIFCVIFVLMTATAYVIYFHLTPRYASTAAVRIESRAPNVVDDTKAVLDDLPQDMASVLTEAEVLRSRNLLRRVVETLGMYERFLLEFEEDSARTRFAWLHRLIPEEWSSVIASLTSAPIAPSATSFLDDVVSRLWVNQIPESRVLQVHFTSPDPDLAALFVNTLVDLYIDDQIQAKVEATGQANKWISAQIKELDQQAKESEQAVEQFRNESNLLQAENIPLVAQQVVELSTQLTANQAKRAEAEARAAQLESFRDSDMKETISEVASSPIFQDLFANESELVRKMAEYTEVYGDRHPEMVKLRAEIQKFRSRISDEVDKTIQTIRNEARAARIRENVIRGKLDQYRDELMRANLAKVRLGAMDREAEANRNLAKLFWERLKETALQMQQQAPDATIISYADAPEIPTYPRKRLLLLISFIGSAFIGLGAGLVRDQYKTAIHSLEEVRDQLSVNSLGLIPELRKARGAIAIDDARDESSSFKEALRHLHTTLAISNRDRYPKSILIASSLPDEGKTSLVCSFARYLSNAGKAVAVVDCDLRNPELHQHFGVPAAPGLNDYFAGKVPLADIVLKDDQSKVGIVPAGTVKASTMHRKVLEDVDVFNLLIALQNDFDLVIIDSPPVLPVSDVRVLAGQVDCTVFLARWGTTPRSVAQEGLRLITEASDSLLGVLLTRVDLQKYARYRPYGSVYSNRYLRKYYS